MADGMTLYVEARLAFVDRPEARLATDTDERGTVWLYAEEWVNGYQVRGRCMIDAESLWHGGRYVCKAVALKFVHEWGRQVKLAIASPTRWVPVSAPQGLRHVQFKGGSRDGDKQWMHSPPERLLGAVPFTPGWTLNESTMRAAPQDFDVEEYQLGKVGEQLVYRLKGWRG